MPTGPDPLHLEAEFRDRSINVVPNDDGLEVVVVAAT
jgi:hypothetical protein